MPGCDLRLKQGPWGPKKCGISEGDLSIHPIHLYNLYNLCIDVPISVSIDLHISVCPSNYPLSVQSICGVFLWSIESTVRSFLSKQCLFAEFIDLPAGGSKKNGTTEQLLAIPVAIGDIPLGIYHRQSIGDIPIWCVRHVGMQSTGNLWAYIPTSGDKPWLHHPLHPKVPSGNHQTLHAVKWTIEISDRPS